MKRFLMFFAFVASAIAVADIQPVNHRQITGNTKVYTADQIDVLLQDAGKVKKIVAGQNITISPVSGEGNVTINATQQAAPVTKIKAGSNITISPATGLGEVTINATGGSSASKRIAMFIIPMNQTSSTSVSTTFKHFELKASYNNFVKQSPASLDPGWYCYYTHSGHADIAGLENNDKAMIFVNHGGTDQRSYVKIPNTIEYLTNYSPESYIVLVDASQCWNWRSDGSWLNSEDNNLIWTYCKTMNSSRETDAGTDHGLWRPIQPVKWLSQLPNWAVQ